MYSFIPNRRGSPFINFRPICHYPRSLFHNPLILIFGRIATTPVYYINPVNLLLIFHIMSTPLPPILIFKQFVQDPLLFHVLPPPPYINFRRCVHYPLITYIPLPPYIWYKRVTKTRTHYLRISPYTQC